MKINCIAIDDEPLALDLIKDYTQKIPFLNLLQTFDSAIESIEFLKNNTVHLLFLDIQMEELTGIQLLNIIKQKPLVIFTTAYDNYAIQGFDLDAVDYLLKPIAFERFVKAVDKVYDRLKTTIEEPQNSQNANTSSADNYVFIKTENHLEKVYFSDILYIEGMGDYQQIVTTSKKIMTLQNFTKLEDALPQDMFCRVHKSYIVSIHKIENIEKNRLIIANKSIPVSDTYRKTFFALLQSRSLM
jgi:two-component system LytT family response regulator